MPNLVCKCKNLITLGAIPSPNKWQLIKDIDVEPMVDKMILNKENEAELFDIFHEVSVEVATCFQCGRIHIDYENNGNFKCYMPED